MEEEEGKKQNFCVECSVAKGYGAYVKEKGEEVLTFFPVSIYLRPDTPEVTQEN
jgi:hypothetical protein